MCLALIAFRPDHPIPLLIAANRDEAHARATSPAHAWTTQPTIYAGRDLLAGGTWMGITSSGRFALITNYRDPAQNVPNAPSRGSLVQRYLESDAAPEVFLNNLAGAAALYNGFNLIVGNRRRVAYYSNRQDIVHVLGPGVYGLSNRLLDTPWPKVTRSKAAFEALLRPGVERSRPDIGSILTLLRDRRPAPENELPCTGVSRERERMLSSPFIVSPAYGTRSSTVAWLDDLGGGTLHEVRYDASGSLIGESALNFEGEYDEQREPTL